MALVEVIQIPDRSMSVDSKRFITGTRTWHVVVDDDEEDDELTVRGYFTTATGIDIGTQYAPLIASYCTGLDFQYGGEGSHQWVVTANYGLNAYASPFDEPPQIDWQAENREVPLDIDSEGTLVVNTAYDPFDPTITRPFPAGRLTVTRNEAEFNWTWASLYSEKINDAPFLGWAARTVRMGSITWTMLYDQDWGWYKRVTYPLYFDPATWDVNVVNLGRRQLVSGNRRPILDNGVPVSEPVKLALDGTALSPSAAPVILTFKPLEAIDFSVYNLDGILPYLLGGVF